MFRILIVARPLEQLLAVTLLSLDRDRSSLLAERTVECLEGDWACAHQRADLGVLQPGTFAS